MGVASGCGEQEAGVASGSGWNLWVWLLDCKEVYRFPHTTYRYTSCICSFLQQHSYFLFIFKNVFRSCSSIYFLVITFYVLNNIFTQYKHTYGQQRASYGSHMKAAHTVLYMKKHTQTYASYPAMDISCMSVV